MTDAPTNAELAERLEADADSLRGDAYNSVDRAFKQWANRRVSLLSLAAERLREFGDIPTMWKMTEDFSAMRARALAAEADAARLREALDEREPTSRSRHD